mgnify:FL=1
MSYLALTLKNFGEPATALELVELPSEEPKHSEAIVSMDAVGMHIADGLFVRGREMITRTMPCVPGFEGVGTVSKIGTGVKNLKEGDKVLLPMGTGSMRQELKIHASQLTKVSKPYAPDEQLALITVNGFTAYFLLKDYRKLKQNDWIIQNAANSNVGRYLIALAKQEGIKTINIVRRKEVAKELKKIGGTEVIISSDEFPSTYLSKFLKRKIMLGIDAVAGDATENLALCLTDGSLLVNYGTVTKRPCHISFWTMFRKDISLTGMSTLNGFKKRSKKRSIEIHKHLAKLANQKLLQAKIAKKYSFEDYLLAYDHIDKTGSERDGKVVLLPNH